MASPLSIVVHCPDRHLSYDGTTPGTTGVGGGVTARIRLAEALARRGHAVEMICHAPRPVVVAGVRYTPLDAAEARACDVLVPMSTGGAMDVSDVARTGHRPRVTVGWVQGFVPVRGLDALQPATTVCCSGFVRDVAEHDWGADPRRLAVLHNGVEQSLLHPRGERDDRRLVYSSHPSKGLAAAVGVLRLLRRTDPGFTLVVVGGAGLWGQADDPVGDEPGVEHLGLLGQERLEAEYWRSGFSLHLQSFEEPYGIAMAEARAAGCVPVASAVGAFPSLLEHGRSGWLVDGDPASAEVQARAADLVLATTRSHGLREHLRRGTGEGVLTWDVLARAWEGLCLRLLDDPAAPEVVDALRCPVDDTPLLPLADGFHCLGCGRHSAAAG